ncbi:MAG: hypothetical protein R3F43_12020 [bacterium]
MATHELGHSLGLDHPCEVGGFNGAPDCCLYVSGQCELRPEVAGTTMIPVTNPGDTSPRVLDPDDIAGSAPSTRPWARWPSRAEVAAIAPAGCAWACSRGCGLRRLCDDAPCPDDRFDCVPCRAASTPSAGAVLRVRGALRRGPLRRRRCRATGRGRRPGRRHRLDARTSDAGTPARPRVDAAQPDALGPDEGSFPGRTRALPPGPDAGGPALERAHDDAGCRASAAPPSGPLALALVLVLTRRRSR